MPADAGRAHAANGRLELLAVSCSNWQQVNGRLQEGRLMHELASYAAVSSWHVYVAQHWLLKVLVAAA